MSRYILYVCTGAPAALRDDPITMSGVIGLGEPVLDCTDDEERQHVWPVAIFETFDEACAAHGRLKDSDARTPAAVKELLS